MQIIFFDLLVYFLKFPNPRLRLQPTYVIPMDFDSKWLRKINPTYYSYSFFSREFHFSICTLIVGTSINCYYMLSKLHRSPSFFSSGRSGRGQLFHLLPVLILLHPIFQPDTNPIGKVAGVVRHQRQAVRHRHAANQPIELAL